MNRRKYFNKEKVVSLTLAVSLLATGCGLSSLDDINSLPTENFLSDQEVKDYYKNEYQYTSKITRADDTKDNIVTVDVTGEKKEQLIRKYQTTMRELFKGNRYAIDTNTHEKFKVEIDDMSLVENAIVNIKRSDSYYFITADYTTVPNQEGTFNDWTCYLGINSAIKEQLDGYGVDVTYVNVIERDLKNASSQRKLNFVPRNYGERIVKAGEQDRNGVVYKPTNMMRNNQTTLGVRIEQQKAYERKLALAGLKKLPTAANEQKWYNEDNKEIKNPTQLSWEIFFNNVDVSDAQTGNKIGYNEIAKYDWRAVLNNLYWSPDKTSAKIDFEELDEAIENEGIDTSYKVLYNSSGQKSGYLEDKDGNIVSESGAIVLDKKYKSFYDEYKDKNIFEEGIDKDADGNLVDSAGNIILESSGVDSFIDSAGDVKNFGTDEVEQVLAETTIDVSENYKAARQLTVDVGLVNELLGKSVAERAQMVEIDKVYNTVKSTTAIDTGNTQLRAILKVNDDYIKVPVTYDNTTNEYDVNLDSILDNDAEYIKVAVTENKDNNTFSFTAKQLFNSEEGFVDIPSDFDVTSIDLSNAQFGAFKDGDNLILHYNKDLKGYIDIPIESAGTREALLTVWKSANNESNTGSDDEIIEDDDLTEGNTDNNIDTNSGNDEVNGTGKLEAEQDASNSTGSYVPVVLEKYENTYRVIDDTSDKVMDLRNGNMVSWSNQLKKYKSAVAASGYGVFSRGNAGLKDFGYNRAGSAGTMRITYVFKQNAKVESDFDFEYFYINNYTSNSVLQDSNVTVADYIKEQISSVIERADRIICNSDISSLMAGDIFEDSGLGLYYSFYTKNSSIIKYTTDLKKIMARNANNNEYLVQVERYITDSIAGKANIASYKDTAYLVIRQDGDEFRINDYTVVKRELLSEPLPDDDDVIKRRLVALNLATQLSDTSKDGIKDSLFRLYSASTMKQLDTIHYTKDNLDGADESSIGHIKTYGLNDCFNSDTKLLSSEDRAYMVSSVANMMTKHGNGVNSRYIGYVPEEDGWICGTSNQAEFRTIEMIDYAGMNLGLYMKVYYLVSRYGNNWVIDDYKVIASEEVSGDNYNTVKAEIEKNVQFDIEKLTNPTQVIPSDYQEVIEDESGTMNSEGEFSDKAKESQKEQNTSNNNSIITDNLSGTTVDDTISQDGSDGNKEETGSNTGSDSNMNDTPSVSSDTSNTDEGSVE